MLIILIFGFISTRWGSKNRNENTKKYRVSQYTWDPWDCPIISAHSVYVYICRMSQYTRDPWDCLIISAHSLYVYICRVSQ